VEKQGIETKKDAYGAVFVENDEDILRKGSSLEIVIDGIRYSSKDPYLPDYIKKALIRIKKENLSPEEIEVKEIKMKKAERKFKIEVEAEKSRYRIIGFSILFTGGILISIFRLLISNKIFKGWIFIFPVIGTLLIIAGLIILSLGLSPDEIERFFGRGKWW